MTAKLIRPDLQLSLIVSSALALQALTFPGFFFSVHFSNSRSVLLSGAQYTSVFGWIVLMFAPPLLILLRTRIGWRFSIYLAIVATIWPASVLLVRFAVVESSGDPVIGYLLEYPIFAFSDIVVPLLYWSMSQHASKLNRLALGRQRLARHR